ncbi:MAG: hypothetical protein ABR990_10300 [Terracidiphilus sp.]|jgi:hypothetical protein
MRIVTLFLTLVLAASIALAQQSVPPPPMPVNDAPANAEVLMLLRAGMPESVVLDKIHAITGKFDTSTSALITLKQAGATEAELKAVLAQGAAPADSQSAAEPATGGPSLAESLKFIQDKVNQQGEIVYSDTPSYANNGESLGSSFQYSQESQVVAFDPAGGLSLQEKTSVTVLGTTSSGTTTWQVSFKDLDKLEVMNSGDLKHSLNQGFMYQDIPQFFELVVHMASGKTVRQHSRMTICTKGIILSKQSCKNPESDTNVGVFTLHFRDEEMAGRVAKAMIHAIDLCGGGSPPEPF